MGANLLSTLLLVRSLEAGGTERQLVALARGLHRRGHKVTVAVFYNRGSLLGELQSAGVPVIDLRKRGRWDLLGFLVRTVLAIRRTKPDILYSFLGGANIVAAVSRWFVPPMKVVWSIRSSNMNLACYDWTHSAAYWLECRMSRTADLIISNSHSGLEYAVDHGFPRERICVVPNGIDTNRFKPADRIRRTQRAKWGLTEDEVAVGVLARLDPMKGHKDFLDAAASVSKQNPKTRFFIIGEGPEERALREHAAKQCITDRTTFVGPIDNPEAALPALDICCSPSVTEGFSNSIAEAMACGVPCVVTDVGDSAVIVGETGETTPPSDPAALSRAIVTLAKSLHHGRRQQAVQRIVNLYSVETMVKRTIAALQQGAVPQPAPRLD